MEFNNNYTGRSMVELRSRLISKIPELTDKWTNYNESDLGIAFIELMTGVADMLGFYLDKQSLETYLPTVQQRKNAKAILNSMNYKLHMKGSNVTTAKLEVTEPFGNLVIIPRYTQLVVNVEGAEPIYYATSEEVSLLPNHTSVEVKLIQGRHYVSNMTVGDLKTFKILIPIEDIAEGSVKLSINGEEWTEVPDVITDDSHKKIFSIHENNNDQAYIMLPLDYERLLPTDLKALVKIEFLQTLGTGGVIKSGTVLTVVSELSNGEIDLIKKFHATTLEISSGGCDRESIEKARVQAPKEWSTMNYAVTLSDFEVLANSYVGVNKAIAVDWTTEEGMYVQVPYLVKIFALPESYSRTSDELGHRVSNEFLKNIKSYLEERKLVSTIVEVEEPEFIPIDIGITVHHRYPDNRVPAIRDLILNTIESYMKPENLEFGRSIHYSNIISNLESSFNLVRYIELNTISSVSLKLNQLPEWGEIEVTMIRSDY